MSDMDVFFHPKAIAIIGASDSFKFGYTTTKYLLASKFKTFPVNIKKKEIHGHNTYKNIKEIPEEIDLAIILVGNEIVLQTVRDCIEKGVKGIIIEKPVRRYAMPMSQNLLSRKSFTYVFPTESPVICTGPAFRCMD